MENEDGFAVGNTDHSDRGWHLHERDIRRLNRPRWYRDAALFVSGLALGLAISAFVLVVLVIFS